MDVISTKGIKSYWNPSLTKDNERHVSQYHEFARDIISKTLPGYRCYEEITIPNEKLYLDFYVPLKKLAVEVHGIQHYKFIPHFHINKFGYAKSQERDNRKRQWCQINDIQLVEFKYDEQDRWECQIVNRHEQPEDGCVAKISDDPGS